MANEKASSIARLPSLDYLRGLAALSVALPHYFMLGTSDWPLLEVVSILAVEQFFVLSGFVLAPQMLHCLQAVTHRDIGVFLVRRWMRTIPPYLVALGIVALMTANIYNSALPAYAIYIQNLLKPLPEASDFFPVAWSLAVEEWFYLVFALLLLIARILRLSRRSFVIVTIAVAIAIALGRLSLDNTSNWDASVRRVVVFRLDSIAYGFLLYCVIEDVRNSLDKFHKWMLPALLIASGFLAYHVGWEATAGKSPTWQQVYPFASSLFAVVTILALVHYDRLFHIQKRLAETGYFFGKISYTIYLFHLPAIMLLRPYISHWPVYLQIAAYIFALIAFCSAFYFSFEAPILDARPHYRQMGAQGAVRVGPGFPHWQDVSFALRLITKRRHLLALTALVLCIGALAAIERTQQLNITLAFYVAVAAAAFMFSVFLLLSTLWNFALLRGLAVASIAFSFLLPFADSLLESIRSRKSDRPVTAVYSFRQAQGNPEAFSRWWAEYADAWQKSAIPLQARDPKGVLPFVMVPNSRSSFFQAPIEINNLGFRGPNIEIEKGDSYRIFVLGESPTFGTMIRPEDTTWVRALEDFVAGNLVCKRRVEVINAGTVGYNISNNIERLQRDIIPLQPDMIISYHGYNSFRMIDTDLVNLPTPPLRRRRGSLLISEFRFHLRLMAYNSAVTRMADKPMTPYSDEHAKKYEQLAEIAQINKITPVFATLSLAINSNSPQEVMDFYGRVFRPIERILPAVAEHNRIVEQAARKTGAHFIDSRPGLDGEWDRDYFIDIVHFTHNGAVKLAANMFESIAALLKKDAGCEDRK